MFIVQSYGLAVVMCFITMLCWGSWANTRKLTTGEWPFQLFYWDYSFGALLLALLAAFTVGSTGEFGRSFLPDLGQASTFALGSALLGGIIFNLSNILLVAAIDVAGMAVAFPVGVGIALVLGVVTNYVAEPIGNPVVLFGGVGLVVLAIVVDALSYRRLNQGGGVGASTRGIVLSIVAGVLMGFFFRFVTASMSTDFMNMEAGKMSPYSAIVVFSVGIVLSNFLWNTLFMYRPIAGPPATYGQYFRQGTPRLHAVGILGGMIWNVGTLLSVIAGDIAGFAISYGLGQGATLVAAFWGVFIWKEFRHAPPGTNKYLALMFLLFILGLGLIIWARLV